MGDGSGCRISLQYDLLRNGRDESERENDEDVRKAVSASYKFQDIGYRDDGTGDQLTIGNQAVATNHLVTL